MFNRSSDITHERERTCHGDIAPIDAKPAAALMKMPRICYNPAAPRFATPTVNRASREA